MKKTNVVITAIVSTITIMLTVSIIYPTRNEVDAKVMGLEKQINLLHKDIINVQNQNGKILFLLQKRKSCK